MAEKYGRVAVVGSLNADLTVRVERFPGPGETLTGSELVVAPGGKGSNQAAAAAMLGSSVRLIGAVGDDDHGSFLLGGGASRRRRRRGRTSAGRSRHRHRDDRGRRGGGEHDHRLAGGERCPAQPGAGDPRAGELPEPVSAHALDGADVLCLCLEVPVDTVIAAARLGRAAGATVLLNLSPYAVVGSDLLELTDVLLVNRSEAALLLGMDTLPDDPSDWPELPVARAVVTLGGDGAVVVDRTPRGAGAVTAIPPTWVDVVDTTGSGDAFTGDSGPSAGGRRRLGRCRAVRRASRRAGRDPARRPVELLARALVGRRPDPGHPHPPPGFRKVSG